MIVALSIRLAGVPNWHENTMSTGLALMVIDYVDPPSFEGFLCPHTQSFSHSEVIPLTRTVNSFYERVFECQFC